jgi:hypothetical protein
MNFTQYLEAIQQHYNIDSNFVLRSYDPDNLKDKFFDNFDQLNIFRISLKYINNVLKENKVNKKLILEVKKTPKTNTEVFNVFNDFVQEKININDLKQKIVDFLNEQKITMDQIRDSFGLKIKITLEKPSISESLHVPLLIADYKVFFETYHDFLFHLLSDPQIIYKFKKEKNSDFDQPINYSPSNILKELFSTQTNPFRASVDDLVYDKLKFGEIVDDYDIFEKMSYWFNERNIPLTWKNFRKEIKNFPKIIKLFPSSIYPDDHYFYEPKDYDPNTMNVTFGDTNKIIMAHQIKPDLFQGKKDKIKNFEGEISFILKKVKDLIDKHNKFNNNKYLNQLK